MKVVGLGLLFFCLLFLFMKKDWLKKTVEIISIYWFRFAFSVLLLFILNIAGGFIGINIAVNIASSVVITVLGLPGIISICIISIFL